MLPMTRASTSNNQKISNNTHKESRKYIKEAMKSLRTDDCKMEKRCARVLQVWTIILIVSSMFSSRTIEDERRMSGYRGSVGGSAVNTRLRANDRESRKSTFLKGSEGRDLGRASLKTDDDDDDDDDEKFLKVSRELYRERVPVALSKLRIRSQNEFTCGGSHVVKMKKYVEMKKQSGSSFVNALPAEDWFTEAKDLEDDDDNDIDNGNDKAIRRKDGDDEEDHLVERRKKKRYKSCAVVGNSGSLLETQYGFDIDKNEAVIRFNAAVTQGYEQFVGQKTTVRLLNAVDYKGPEGSEEELRLTTARGSDVKVWVRKLEQKPEEIRNKSFVLDPEMLCHAWAWIGKHGEKPSSGLVGVVLALKMCEKVEMYGFQSKNYFGKFSRPHYYDWERPQKGREKVHPFQREVDLYQALEKNGYLKTFT